VSLLVLFSTDIKLHFPLGFRFEEYLRDLAGLSGMVSVGYVVVRVLVSFVLAGLSESRNSI